MYKLRFLIIIIFYSVLLNKSYCIENKIVLKIDKEIITSLDIDREMRYLTALNPYIKNIEINKLSKIAKSSLIREKVKEIELFKNFKETKLEESYLDQFIANTYKKIGLNTKKEFIDYLRKKKLSYKDIKKKISIEIAWNRLIYLKYESKLKINEDELKEQILKNINKTQEKYFLQEILFESKNNALIEEKYKQIKKSIQNDGFEKAAIIFSISSTAKNGGTIGWVNKNSLNSKINDSLEKIKVGEITEPIVIPGGFLILKIKDLKAETNKISSENLENELKKLVKQKTNEQLNQFSIIYYKKIEKNIPINEL